MRRISALLVVLAVLVVAGCGSAQQAAPSQPAEQLPPQVGTGKVADYEFTSTTLAGESFSGTSLEGRPAVLWFWAPWCPTCRAQVPTVTRLADEYDGRVAVVGVGGLDDRAAIEGLAAEIPHVHHLVDAEGEIWKHFGVVGQSSYAVIAPDGEILAEGFLANEELTELVERMAQRAEEEA